jgi:exodeoxyribonuclease V alpha subunit
LAQQLTKAIITDMEIDTGIEFNPNKPWELWRSAFQAHGNQQRPEYQQVISPYRGELFGVEHLNTVLQQHSKGRKPDFHRQINGISLFDKVMQFRSRGKSDPLWAWNVTARKNEALEVFNGELGFVKAHALDSTKWKYPDFHIKRFQVVFSRKEQMWVGYGHNLGQRPDGR